MEEVRKGGCRPWRRRRRQWGRRRKKSVACRCPRGRKRPGLTIISASRELLLIYRRSFLGVA